MSANQSRQSNTGETFSIGPRSKDSFARAQLVFPDGTARVTIERDPTPRYMEHGAGSYLFDLDGRRFLDLNCNFTTLIHGHAFAPVIDAVTRQLQRGSCFANPTESEIELAELLCARIPHLDRVRFVNTGTEAVMFAIKAARAFTGRPKIAKLEGAYHGAYDYVEVSQAATPQDWGDAAAPNSTPFYRGMPQSVLDEVVVLRFNDPEGARRLLSLHADKLAAVVIDPMPSRAGLISPKPEFIAAVQETARNNGNPRHRRRSTEPSAGLSGRFGALWPGAGPDGHGQDHRRRPAHRRGRRPQRRHEGVRCIGRPAAVAAGRDVLRQSAVDGRGPRIDAASRPQGFHSSGNPGQHDPGGHCPRHRAAGHSLVRDRRGLAVSHPSDCRIIRRIIATATRRLPVPP